MDGDRLLDVLGLLVLIGLIGGLALLLTVGIDRRPATDTGPPSTEWELERVNETHARLRLTSGGPIETENLVVTVNETPREIAWPGTLFNGDSGVLKLQNDRRVSVYWASGAGEDRTRLFSGRLGN